MRPANGRNRAGEKFRVVYPIGGMSEARATMAVMVRYECGQQDRVSKEYGPYDAVQLTYKELRETEHGETIAAFYDDADEWHVIAEPGVWYSDIIIWSV